jgi:hypothetical protein
VDGCVQAGEAVAGDIVNPKLKRTSKLIDRFIRSTALRNEFNQSMYVTDEAGQITHTQSMRIVESREHLQCGISKSLDDARLKNMIEAATNPAVRTIVQSGHIADCPEGD